MGGAGRARPGHRHGVIDRRLEDEARRQGYGQVVLDTNKALIEAHALYRKAGYRETERFNDNPYAHLWFVKDLT